MSFSREKAVNSAFPAYNSAVWDGGISSTAPIGTGEDVRACIQYLLWI
jgi:hypothetical protein